jgi:hypothetical protein
MFTYLPVDAAIYKLAHYKRVNRVIKLTSKGCDNAAQHVIDKGMPLGRGMTNVNR